VALGKILASFGMGAAKVDTILEKPHYYQGESVKGEVVVEGGKARQTIDQIYLYLVVRWKKEGSSRKHVWYEFPLLDGFEIEPGATKKVPFQFELPLDAPITTDDFEVYFKTGADIDNAVDPTDKDYIQVSLHRRAQAVFDSLKKMGFQPKAVEAEFTKYKTERPFVQEFAFHPPQEYRYYLDEVELAFTETGEAILEVDRSDRGPNGDETKVRFSVTEEDLVDNAAPLQKKIQQIIERYKEA
jgi:sporulation-control protein